MSGNIRIATSSSRHQGRKRNETIGSLLAGATASTGGASNPIRMEIKDNGKGFEVDRVRFAKRHKQLGLLGMRERVELVGGSFAVVSAPGQGTTTRAQIPFCSGA